MKDSVTVKVVVMLFLEFLEFKDYGTWTGQQRIAGELNEVAAVFVLGTLDCIRMKVPKQYARLRKTNLSPVKIRFFACMYL